MVVSLWSRDGSGANHVNQEKEDDRTIKRGDMVVSLSSRDFFPPLYLNPRFRPLLLKYICIYSYVYNYY